MYTINVLFFLVLSSISIAVKRELCDFEDQECITLAMRRVYPIIVAGNKKLGLKPADTLEKDEIVANLPTLNYTLTNVKMRGYSKCVVREARFRLEHSTWHIFLDCPHLDLDMNYIFDGFVAAEKLVGEGTANIVFDKYEISFNGRLEKEIRNGKSYIHLISYAPSRLEVIDKIHFTFNNLFANEEKSKKMNKFINNHWQEFNSQAKTPAITAIIGVLVDRCNDFFQQNPVEELFTKI